MLGVAHGKCPPGGGAAPEGGNGNHLCTADLAGVPIRAHFDAYNGLIKCKVKFLFGLDYPESAGFR